MNGKNKKTQTIHFKRILFLVMILAVAVSGCEPLRKKFIREKKKDKKGSAQFVPVFEPVDYPAKYASPQNRYKHHYQLWKVYHKDFLTALREDAGDKRLMYIITQGEKQLMEMQQFIIPEKQGLLVKHIESCRKIKETLDMPPALRNNTSIRLRMERLAKRIKHDFPISKVKEFIRE